MTRSAYQSARMLVRANGLYALTWMTPEAAATMNKLATQGTDALAERATWAAKPWGTTKADIIRLTTHLPIGTTGN